MASQNRKNRRVGIGAGAVLGLLLGTGALLAMHPDGPRRPRIDVQRRNALIALESAAGSFGDTDWSWIQDSLVTAPDASSNAETMFVFLSLGNVYLNRFELRRDLQGLSRSVDWFEWVVDRHDVWGNRGASGAVIAYLGISVARLEGECEIGGLAQRFEQLRGRVILITEEEARFRATVVESARTASPGESEASDAALFAAAHNLLPGDRDAGRWDQTARSLAASVLSHCPTPASLLFLSEGALTYPLAGSAVPDGFRDLPVLSPALRSRVICGRADPRSVAAAEVGDPLSAAIDAAEGIASSLTESFLWRFSPGVACQDPDDSDGRDRVR